MDGVIYIQLFQQREENINFLKSLPFFQMSLKELMTCLRSHS